MEIQKILDRLRSEADAIDDAIVAMERLATSKGSAKRGRPPKWLAEARKRTEKEAKYEQ